MDEETKGQREVTALTGKHCNNTELQPIGKDHANIVHVSPRKNMKTVGHGSLSNRHRIVYSFLFSNKP
jgi:hypothetical protein